MSFDELRQANVDSTLELDAFETIEYRVYPGDFRSINARVERDVFDADELRVKNVIEVLVSRSSIACFQFGRDQVRAAEPDGSTKTYTVVDDIQERRDKAYARLRCILSEEGGQ